MRQLTLPLPGLPEPAYPNRRKMMGAPVASPKLKPVFDFSDHVLVFAIVPVAISVL